MAETIGGLGILDIVIEGHEYIKPGDIVIMRTNGADIKPGHLVGELAETHPDIDLVAADELNILGIVRREVFPGEDYDIDDAIADNKYVEVLLKGAGGGKITVAMLWEALAGGAVSGSASDQVVAGTEDAGHVTYEAAAAAGRVVGRLLRAVTGHATNVKVALVRWGA